MSSKFKVGDYVTATNGAWSSKEGNKIIEITDTDYIIASSYDESLFNPYPFSLWNDRLELVTPADTYQSPVKERVVKEVVAGDYHKVCVEYSRDGKNDLRVFTNLFVNPTTQDLRHAAQVFNDIADVLETKD